MGIHLVRLATEYALPRLDTHAARVALLVMCSRAKDTDEQPQFRAGSASLEKALGYELGTEAGRQAVSRAIRELRQRAFICQDEDLPRRWKRRWNITLPGPPLAPGAKRPEDRDDSARSPPALQKPSM